MAELHFLFLLPDFRFYAAVFDEFLNEVEISILGIDLVFVQQLVYRELLTRLTANADDPQYIIVIFQAFE